MKKRNPEQYSCYSGSEATRYGTATENGTGRHTAKHIVPKMLVFCIVAACAVLPGLFLGPAGTDYNVVIHFRLPRILAACIAGAALGLSGTIFQGVLKNPLADPYLLGTSSGASAAAAFCFLTGIDRGIFFFFIVSAGAFAGTFISYSLAVFSGKLSDSSLVLSGVAVSAFLSAIVMLAASAGGEKALPLLGFIMGGFSVPSIKELAIAGGILAVVLILSVAKSRQLDVFSLGEEKTYHLGADPEKGRLVFFILASAASAAAVALCGTIGFVGLMTPHIMRMMFSPIAAILLPAATAGGAVLLCAADTAGRTVFAPQEIPAGILMALCGAPFFLWLLFRQCHPEKISIISEISDVPGSSIKSGKSEHNNQTVQSVNDRQPADDRQTAVLPAVTPLLKVRGLSAENASRKLFSNLEISLNQGEFLGILGPNGAGKSTLLKIISGFIKNDAEIFIDGIRRNSITPRELAGKLAWLPGELDTPYDFTVLDFVKMGCSAGFSHSAGPAPLTDCEKAMNALYTTGAGNLAYRNLNSLSSGERQLVFLAQALAQGAGLMLLDEPVSHLDLYYKSSFIDLVLSLVRGETEKNGLLTSRGKKYAAAAVFHEPALAVKCDKILLMGHGWHFTGSPEKALTRDKLSELYGIEKDSMLLQTF